VGVDLWSEIGFRNLLLQSKPQSSDCEFAQERGAYSPPTSQNQHAQRAGDVAQRNPRMVGAIAIDEKTATLNPRFEIPLPLCDERIELEYTTSY
jgi:hypothetical protein